MSVARPHPLSDTALLNLAAAGVLLAALLVAWFAPLSFGSLLAAASAVAVLFMAFRWHVAFCVVWLLLTGASLEMTASDLIGPQAFLPAIAIVKGAGIGLAAVAVLRYGPRLDVFNPAWAWLAMYASGLVHGLWPGLAAADSLRSLIGSAAPFAFGFSRLSHGWAEAIIRAACLSPLLTVAAGGILDAAGIRPLFVDSGGLRLMALGHPAFLGSVCETAVYACLIELFRTGRRRDATLLGTNLLLLLLTGARAPLTLATAVVALSLTLVRAPAFPARFRVLVILAGAAAMPLAVVLVLGLLPSDVSLVRAVHILTANVASLSGRQLLWPNFEQAAAGSWWLGWGVGSGNVIIPPDDPIVGLLQTWAAHNEYLRIEVEGGQLGRGLLLLMFVLWVRRHTAPLCGSDRVIMRLVFVAYAVHALTDNLLISTPACVFFAFAVAVFTRGAYETATAGQASLIQ